MIVTQAVCILLLSVSTMSCTDLTYTSNIGMYIFRWLFMHTHASIHYNTCMHTYVTAYFNILCSILRHQSFMLVVVACQMGLLESSSLWCEFLQHFTDVCCDLYDTVSAKFLCESSLYRKFCGIALPVNIVSCQMETVACQDWAVLLVQLLELCNTTCPSPFYSWCALNETKMHDSCTYRIYIQRSK